MKNTNKNLHDNDIVTKGYLDRKLDEKLSKYATKDYLDRRLSEEFSKNSDKIKQYIDYRLEPIEKFMQKFERFHEDIMTKLDWLITKYQKFEQEYLVQSEINRRILDRLESHENSIIHLKKITSNLQS